MWIPYDYVEDSPLPKPGELVWINDEFYYGVTVGYWDGWWRVYSGSDDVSISHWMPLTPPASPTIRS